MTFPPPTSVAHSYSPETHLPQATLTHLPPEHTVTLYTLSEGPQCPSAAKLSSLTISVPSLVHIPLCVNGSQGSTPEPPGVWALKERMSGARGRVKAPPPAAQFCRPTKKLGQLKSRPPVPPSGSLTKRDPNVPQKPVGVTLRGK